MKAPWLLACALALASCVNLSDDDRRAYACNRDAGGAQCTGGYVCSITGRCVDPSIGTNTACFETADCMGNFKCSITGRCVDPDIGENTVCNDTGDCMGDFVCNLEKTCVDPAIGTASKCVVDSDCMGDWRCGVDGVCATPGHDGVPADATVRYARPMNVTLMSPLSGAFMSPTAKQLSLTSPQGDDKKTQVAAFTSDGGSLVERVRWPSSFSPDLADLVQREQVPAPPEGLKRLVARHHQVLALTNTGGFLSWPEGAPAMPPWQPVDAGIGNPTGLWSLNSVNDWVLAQSPTGYWSSTTFNTGPIDAQLPPGPLVDAVSVGVDGVCAVLAWPDRMRLLVVKPGDKHSVPLASGNVRSVECSGMGTQMTPWQPANIISVHAAGDGTLGVVTRDAGVDALRFVNFKAFAPGGPTDLMTACGQPPAPYDGGCTFDSENSAECQPCDGGTLLDLQVEAQPASHNWVGWARCDFGGPQEVRRVSATSSGCHAERVPTPSTFTLQQVTPEETNHSLLGAISTEGWLWSGTTPLDAMALTVSHPPNDVTTMLGGPLLVGSELGRYQPGIGFVAMRSGQGSDIGSAVQNYPSWVQFSGMLVDTKSVTGSDAIIRVVAEREDGVALNGLLTMTPEASGHRWLLYATDDTLYTADVTETLAGGPRAELAFQLTPSPGNPVLAMVPVQPTGDAVVSVYVLTTSGLALVTGSEGRRWRAQPLDIGDGVAIGLFAEGAYARVVFDDGRILSLPSRLLMAEPRQGAVLQDVDTLCGQPVGLFSDGLYRLAAPVADAGYGTWAQVLPMNGDDGVLLTAPQPLLTPDAGSALWVFEATGRASEITVTGCE